MKTDVHSKDPYILKALPALRRAARSARKLAEETGTPFYVVKDGRVVNLNPNGRLRKPPRPIKLTP
jgi:hypothetical protein